MVLLGHEVEAVYERAEEGLSSLWASALLLVGPEKQVGWPLSPLAQVGARRGSSGASLQLECLLWEAELTLGIPTFPTAAQESLDMVPSLRPQEPTLVVPISGKG